MVFSKTILSVTLVTFTIAGCTTAPETERFAVELDEGMYINNDVPIIDKPEAQAKPGVFVGTVHASEFDCPQMPCNDDERLAKEQAYWDQFRTPKSDNTATF